MPKKRISLHTSLKDWLIELGKKNEYKAYSGDSQPLDIRYKSRHIEYKPDVIWEKKGKYYIFELAFTEDWRAIVGEYYLASCVPGCDGFIVLCYYAHDFLNNVFNQMSNTLKNDVMWGFYPLDNESLEEIEKETKRWLRNEFEWIS